MNQSFLNNISFKLTWERGALIIAYFLILSITAGIPALQPLLLILAWPLYTIPWTILASITQVLFAYALALIITSINPPKKRTQTP